MPDAPIENPPAAPAKPELKSFEAAAADFMKQAAANEYPSDEPEEAPAQTPEPKKEEAKPAAGKPVEKSELRRAPDAVFTKETPAEKKPDETASAFDAVADPNFKDPARAEQWKTVKNMGKEWETKARTLERQLAELGQSSKANADFEKQLAERDAKIKELTDREATINWENSEGGGAKYRTARSAIVDQAKRLIADNDGDANAVETALNLKGKARLDALKTVAEELPGFQQGLLGQMIRELDVLDTEAASKRENASKSWQEMQKAREAQERQAEEEFHAHALKSYEGVKRELARELEVLREVEGSEWWNEQRGDILAKADKFYSENTDIREAGKAAIWKEAGPVYRELYMEERKHTATIEKELTDAKKALEEAYGSGPRARGSLGDGTKNVKNMTWEERVAYEQGRDHPEER